MNAAPQPDQDLTSAALPSSLGRLLAWLAIAAAAGVLVGGAAAEAARWFAPLFFFPFVVGVVLGGILAGAVRMGQFAHRPTVVAGVLAASLLAAAAQHYVAYRLAKADAERTQADWALAREAFPDKAGVLSAAAPPSDFSAYMTAQAAAGRRLFRSLTVRGWAVWASWAADAAITLAVAVAIVWAALLLPFCRRCRTWYRTIRSGRLRPAGARLLAAAVHLELPQKLISARYRLLACGAGCGPTGLELLVNETKADHDSTVLWLDTAARNAVTAVLDEIHAAVKPAADAAATEGDQR